MNVPRHLESIVANLSPATSLKAMVIEHAYWLAWQRGKMPPLEDVLADIDRIKDAAWTERAEQEAAAGWGEQQEQAIAAVVNDDEIPY